MVENVGSYDRVVGNSDVYVINGSWSHVFEIGIAYVTVTEPTD